MRAESRVQRFIDAALDLLNESGPGKDFTVQDVVERSGQSLRSFYQHFGGKQELLLALFEESVRMTAEDLRESISGESEPLERFHLLVVEYYDLCRPNAKVRGRRRAPLALAEFAQHLLTANAREATRAFAPLVSLFSDVFEDAVTSGALRTDLDRQRLVGIILETIMFNSFSSTIGGAASASGGGRGGEELWEFVLHGIGAGPSSPPDSGQGRSARRRG